MKEKIKNKYVDFFLKAFIGAVALWFFNKGIPYLWDNTAMIPKRVSRLEQSDSLQTKDLKITKSMVSEIHGAIMKQSKEKDTVIIYKPIPCSSNNTADNDIDIIENNTL